MSTQILQYNKVAFDIELECDRDVVDRYAFINDEIKEVVKTNSDKVVRGSINTVDIVQTESKHIAVMYMDFHVKFPLSSRRFTFNARLNGLLLMSGKFEIDTTQTVAVGNEPINSKMHYVDPIAVNSRLTYYVNKNADLGKEVLIEHIRVEFGKPELLALWMDQFARIEYSECAFKRLNAHLDSSLKMSLSCGCDVDHAKLSRSNGLDSSIYDERDEHNEYRYK